MSASTSRSSAAASDPTCGPRLATRTGSTGCCNPIGVARSRKSSGCTVLKTEMPRRNSTSAGPARVPGDLRTNPQTTAAIPNGIQRTPTRTNTSPTRTPRRPWRSVHQQRASPDARPKCTLIAAKNCSGRSGRRDPFTQGGRRVYRLRGRQLFHDCYCAQIGEQSLDRVADPLPIRRLAFVVAEPTQPNEIIGRRPVDADRDAHARPSRTFWRCRRSRARRRAALLADGSRIGPFLLTNSVWTCFTIARYRRFCFGLVS